MESDIETVSIFVEYFGSSPYIKVLDYLISGFGFDYSMTEIARGAGVGWSAFTNVWSRLLEKKIIVQTRTVGNAKLFTLNKEDEFVKKIVKFDWEITKLEMDKVHEEIVVLSKKH